MGYLPYQDYMDFNFFNQVMQRKKIVLSYGVCHIRAISECLEKATDMKYGYEFFYFDNYLVSDIEKQAKFNFLLDKCHVFIYSLGISKEEFINNSSILMRIDEKTKRISVPTITFSGYFPKKDFRVNNLNEFSVQSVRSNYTPFSFGDEKINFMLKENKGQIDILKEAENFWQDDKEWIQKNCEREIKKIEMLEAFSDLKISKYIKENYRKRRLFRNEAHMENDIIIEFAKQVLGILNENQAVDEEFFKEPLLKCSQHLIFPVVAKILELEWDVMVEEYDLFTYHGWEKLGFVDFLKCYIEYCSAMKKLIEQGLIPAVEG